MRRLLTAIMFLAASVTFAANPRVQIYPDLQFRAQPIPLILYQLSTDNVRCHVLENEENYVFAAGWYANFVYSRSEDHAQVVTVAGTVTASTNLVDFTFATNELSRAGKWLAGQIILTNSTQRIVWNNVQLEIKKSPGLGGNTPLAMQTPITWSSVTFVDNMLSEQISSNSPTDTMTLHTDGTYNYWSPTGAGDMLRAIYDVPSNGIVDTSDAFIAWTNTAGVGANAITSIVAGTAIDVTRVGRIVTVDVDGTETFNASGATNMSGTEIRSGTVAEARIASTMATDAEVSSATGALHTIVSAEIDADIVIATNAVATTADFIDHGNTSGKGDDDHPQYILASGARAWTGADNKGGQSVTNVDNMVAFTFGGTSSATFDAASRGNKIAGVGSAGTISFSDSYGSFFLGGLTAGAVDFNGTYACTFHGLSSGTITFDNGATLLRAAGIDGLMGGTVTVSGDGSRVFGAVDATAVLTNSGVGSVAIVDLDAGEKALLSGNASLLVTDGPATNTHAGAGVFGEAVSQGDGTVTTENGFYEGTTKLQASRLCEQSIGEHTTQDFTGAGGWERITNWSMNICDTGFTRTHSNITVAATDRYLVTTVASFTNDTGAALFHCHFFTNNAEAHDVAGKDIGWYESVPNNGGASAIGQRTLTIQAGTICDFRIDVGANETIAWDEAVFRIERK